MMKGAIKRKKIQDKLENENNVKKLTKKEEDSAINIDDSSLNQTKNIKLLTNFEHSNSKQLDKISTDEKSKLKIF